MAAEKEIWQKIGEGFVQEYYNQFDNTNRMGLANLYSPNACLTWEGSPFQGREAIANKLVSLPFKRIKHIITEQDSQPTIDSCILIMVFGQLQDIDNCPQSAHFVQKGQCKDRKTGQSGCELGLSKISIL
uniref:Nuclear transport factor 2 n=1 Tax=Fundulus heteroclitus TaxID=8078 RepID=A0A3Q2PVQ8_FUNHE